MLVSKGEFSQRLFAFWKDRVPLDIAVKQVSWERWRYAYNAHEQGLTYGEIAKRMGVTGSAIQQYCRKFSRVLQNSWAVAHGYARSPVEKYLTADVVKAMHCDDKIQTGVVRRDDCAALRKQQASELTI